MTGQTTRDEVAEMVKTVLGVQSEDTIIAESRNGKAGFDSIVALFDIPTNKHGRLFQDQVGALIDAIVAHKELETV